MKASQAEKGRIFLVNSMFTSFYGLAFAEWVRLLWKHRFDVDPPYGPRAALMTLTSTLTSLLRAMKPKRTVQGSWTCTSGTPVHPGTSVERYDLAT